MRWALRKHWCSRWASRRRVLGFHSPERAGGWGGVGWGQDNSGREGCGLPVLIHLCLAPVEVGGGGWWTDVTLHFWQVLALGGAGISWAALGAMLMFPSLGWNVMEDPGGECGGWREFEKETIPVSTSPAALGSLRCLPPSEGLVPGGREAVFLGLCSRPSRQVSRPRNALSSLLNSSWTA